MSETSRLCKDCPHAKCTPGSHYRFRYWCGLSEGNGEEGTALGIRPWYALPHPLCPLNPKAYTPRVQKGEPIND
jgi:hypothetical protein